MAQDNATHDTNGTACPTCGGASETQRVPVTFWIGAMLQMVENVPARVCTRCGVRQYSDPTEGRLSALIAAGAPSWKASRVVSVPVFEYDDIESLASGLLGSAPGASRSSEPAKAENDPATSAALDPSGDENTRY